MGRGRLTPAASSTARGAAGLPAVVRARTQDPLRSHKGSQDDTEVTTPVPAR